MWAGCTAPDWYFHLLPLPMYSRDCMTNCWLRLPTPRQSCNPQLILQPPIHWKCLAIRSYRIKPAWWVSTLLYTRSSILLTDAVYWYRKLLLSLPIKSVSRLSDGFPPSCCKKSDIRCSQERRFPECRLCKRRWNMLLWYILTIPIPPARSSAEH